MPWTTPGTATAGSVLTASFLNVNLRDNLLMLQPAALAWTSWTPTLAQGVSTNISKTVTYAKYVQVGKTVWGIANLAITGSGTSGSAITISLPVTAAVSGIHVGVGQYASSGVNFYPAIAVLLSTTTVALYRADQPGTGQIGVDPATAAKNLDNMTVSFLYEAA